MEQMNDEMGKAEPERLTSLCEAIEKGEEVLKMVSCLTEGFNQMLVELAPNTESPTNPTAECPAPNNRIEGLKFIFEKIECKLGEITLIKNQLINIIG